MRPETFKPRPLNAASRWLVMAAPLLVLLLMLAFPWIFDVPFGRLPVRAQVEIVLVPVVFAASTFAIVRFRDAARLVLDDAGIKVETGVPSWLGTGRWSLGWGEIGAVRTLAGLGVIQLQRKGSLVRRPLRVHDWIPADGPVPPAPAAFVLRRPDVRTAPLWKSLEARGVFARQGGAAGAVDFDLARHPATRAALVVMALLMAYAAADFFLARERWAVLEPSIVAVPGAIGLVFAGLAFVVFLNANRPVPIPKDVCGPLALVFGLAVACAAFYGLLRLNQWAAPLEAHDYVRNVSCDALDPVEPGLPSIEYDDPAKRYWCSVPRDKRQAVLLRRGVGGMYQVDLTEHTRAIRAFNARAAEAAAKPR